MKKYCKVLNKTFIVLKKPANIFLKEKNPEEKNPEDKKKKNLKFFHNDIKMTVFCDSVNI